MRRICGALGVMREGKCDDGSSGGASAGPAPPSGWRPVFAEDHDSVGLRLNDATGWITHRIPEEKPGI